MLAAAPEVNKMSYFQVLIICLYHAINRVRYVHYGTGDEPLVYLTLTTLLMTLLATGMAVGVVLAVGALLYLQVGWTFFIFLSMVFYELVSVVKKHI